MTPRTFDGALHGAWDVATRAAAAHGGPETGSVLARVRRRRRAAIARRGALALVAAGAVAFGGVTLAGALATVPVPGASPSPTATPVSPSPSAAGPEDPRAGTPVNILMAIARGASADDASPGSLESASILHVAADRTRVEVVPMTVQSQMHLGGCASPDGTEIPGQDAPLTFAYSEGLAHGDVVSGIECAVQAIEVSTGVAIDGAYVLDAGGLAAVADGIGGADVCLAEPAVMPDWGIDLLPGFNRLTGEALAAIIRPYHDAATRTVTPAEPVRVEREARAYAGLARSMLASGMLGSPDEMAAFEDKFAARATETGIAADQEAVIGLAYSLRNLDPDAVLPVNVPTDIPDPDVSDATEDARQLRTQITILQWRQVFARIAGDEAPAAAAVWADANC